jgi:hypothetical protein
VKPVEGDDDLVTYVRCKVWIEIEEGQIVVTQA